MSLYKTSIKSKRIKLDQWVQALHGLELEWDGGTFDRNISFFDLLYKYQIFINRYQLKFQILKYFVLILRCEELVNCSRSERD
jgi:hypothetical protein